MSTEENKTLSRRLFEEFWHQKKLDVADEVLHDEHVNYTHGNPAGFPKGSEEFKQFALIYLTAFPDLQVTIEDQIAEGDKVVTRWTAHGTNTGSLFGIPATNKSVTITVISIDHFVDGKLVEAWTDFDNLGMFQQLGVVPRLGNAS